MYQMTPIYTEHKSPDEITHVEPLLLTNMNAPNVSVMCDVFQRYVEGTTSEMNMDVEEGA